MIERILYPDSAARDGCIIVGMGDTGEWKNEEVCITIGASPNDVDKQSLYLSYKEAQGLKNMIDDWFKDKHLFGAYSDD